MHYKIFVFLRIFQFELKDLMKDINELINSYKEKYNKEIISHYVFLENVALMKNELSGLKVFLNEIVSFKVKEYDTLDDLITETRSRLKSIIKKKHLVKALENLINPKIDKVYRYVCLKG